MGSVDALAAPLNPNYQYLRVELNGAPPALLVLGYLDPHPSGDIEVWYSAKGEVLKLQNGRVVGATGLAVDWRRVSYANPPPPWMSVSPSGVKFSRVRDVSPGYRLGLSEQVSLARVTEPPAMEHASGLGAAVVWFRETYADANASTLPDAWFALGRYDGQPSIVWAYQCLAANVCLTLQRWPLEKDHS